MAAAVQHLHSASVGREHVGTSALSHGTFIQVRTHDRHPAVSDPVVHLRAIEPTLDLFATKHPPSAMDGRIQVVFARRLMSIQLALAAELAAGGFTAVADGRMALVISYEKNVVA